MNNAVAQSKSDPKGNPMARVMGLRDFRLLFETGAAEGKRVLEITGEDVAGFCDEVLRNARTYTENRRADLNRDIMNKLGKGKGRK